VSEVERQKHRNLAVTKKKGGEESISQRGIGRLTERQTSVQEKVQKEKSGGGRRTFCQGQNQKATSGANCRTSNWGKGRQAGQTF